MDWLQDFTGSGGHLPSYPPGEVRACGGTLTGEHSHAVAQNSPNQTCLGVWAKVFPTVQTRTEIGPAHPPCPLTPFHPVTLSMSGHPHGYILDPPPTSSLSVHSAQCTHRLAADGTGRKGDRAPPGGLPVDGRIACALPLPLLCPLVVAPLSVALMPVSCLVCRAPSRPCPCTDLPIVFCPAHALLSLVFLPSSWVQ